MFRYIKILLIALCCALSASAESLSERSRISLLSCEPGAPLYMRYGHSAIRVMDAENSLDVVFNYGLFSFETDHFYYKFVKGETWYQLGVESTNGFLTEYRHDHRAVYEQVLNLTLKEREEIWEALLENYRPENREYLYNFVYDNCATRPYKLILNALGGDITSTYEGMTGKTYREFLSHYTGKGSWADFGINLLFGRRADAQMGSADRLFLPEEVMRYMSEATRSDGRALVTKEHIGTFTIEPVRWYETWYFGLSIAGIVLLLISWWDRRRGKLSIWIDVLIGACMVVVVLIVCFLTFVSIHPLVGFGWRLLIIPMIHLCARLIYFVR